ncbi:hypothetical protein IJI31_03230 [bacterium]|nr:hypothetical protein [bacterium]
MYSVKSKIYQEFDKTQKSAWCNYVRAFVKKVFGTDISAEEIFEKLTEDERYYLNLSNSRFPFLENFIDSDGFKKDTIEYIKSCLEYFKYKESQKPLIEAQKAFEKKKRKFLQEVKMSKEKPTKKQLYYYEKLCKEYGIEQKDVAQLSKLDLKNEIGKILDEHSGY